MSDNDLIRRGDALAVVQGLEYSCNAEEDIAALPAVTVGVKPLVWEERNGKSYRQANCVFGQYQVSWLGEFECWQLSSPRKAGQAWKDGFSRHSNKDAAKAAAQADYEARIVAALEPVAALSRCPYGASGDDCCGGYCSMDDDQKGGDACDKDDDPTNARPATSPGVTAGAIPKRAANDQRQ